MKSNMERIAQWAKENPVLAVAVGVVLFAAIALLCAGLWKLAAAVFGVGGGATGKAILQSIKIDQDTARQEAVIDHSVRQQVQQIQQQAQQQEAKDQNSIRRAEQTGQREASRLSSNEDLKRQSLQGWD